jgi:mannosyltransferase
MREKELYYGFRSDGFREKPESVEGLWQFVLDYVAQTKIKPPRTEIDDMPNVSIPKGASKAAVKSAKSQLATMAQRAPLRIYYNNFEIVYLPFFRDDPRVQHFSRAVEKSNGIMRARWGDAPLRWLTAQLFLEDSKIHCFSDISYRHNVYFLKPNCRDFDNQNESYAPLFKN